MDVYLVETKIEYGEMYTYFVFHEPSVDIWFMVTSASGSRLEEVEPFIEGFTKADHWEEIVTYLGEL